MTIEREKTIQAYNNLISLSRLLRTHGEEIGGFAVEARLLHIYAGAIDDAPASFFRHVDGARLLEFVATVVARIDNHSSYVRLNIKPVEQAARSALTSLLALVDHVHGEP